MKKIFDFIDSRLDSKLFFLKIATIQIIQVVIEFYKSSSSPSNEKHGFYQELNFINNKSDYLLNNFFSFIFGLKKTNFNNSVKIKC